MPRRPPHARLLEFLKPYDPAVQSIALAVRDFVLAEAPSINEFVYDVNYAVAIGFTFTTDWRDGPCHVTVYSKHVNLGFQRGAFLPDHDGVLEGTGKAIRHIKVKSLADIRRAVMKRYLRAAIAQAEKVKGASPTTVIKTMAGGRRRPGGVKK